MTRSLSPILFVIFAACHPPSQHETPLPSSDRYQSDALWLCRPDLPGDACHRDLTATELLADGTRKVTPHVPLANPDVDCFYVYPTVDMHLRAGNHTDLVDIEDMQRTAMVQIARFSEVCAVYAPLYRQVSIGTYLDRDESEKNHFFEVAASDVEAAFQHYLTHYNHGRRMVIVGHSQGAQMITTLLQKTFDRDEELRKRLVVALPIGFYADVPEGSNIGSTFTHIPVCSRDDETGCVIAFRTLAAGDSPDARYWQVTPGHRTICQDPAGQGDSARKRSRAYFPTSRAHGVKDVTTPFVLLRDLYSARCVKDPGGRDHLDITEERLPGDQRPSVVDFSHHKGTLGLHIFDMQFSQGDLIDLIRRKSVIK